MKKKKESTTDAVEILRRCYGNNLWRKFCRWWYRRLIRKEIGIYNTGFDDGYDRGYNIGYGNGFLEAGGKGLTDENGPVEKVKYDNSF